MIETSVLVASLVAVLSVTIPLLWFRRPCAFNRDRFWKRRPSDK